MTGSAGRGAGNGPRGMRARRRSRIVKTLTRDGVFLLALLAKTLGERLPRGPGLRFFGAAGRCMFLLPTRDRQRTLSHLRRVYGGQWDENRIRQTAQAVYGELGKNLFDAVHLARLDDTEFRRIVRAQGAEELLEANARGAGLIAVTCHLGCFEMQLGFFGRAGVNGFAIGRRLFDPRIDALVTAARNRTKVEYLYRSDNPRNMMRLLSQGKAMGVLIDQDTRTDGVFAHFLGHLAYTPSGPVRLAMRMGIPLFVTTTARQPDHTHLITVSNRITLDTTGDFETDLVTNVERVNALLSARIMEHPEQWVWMHRRWRRKPTDPGMEKTPNIEKITNASKAILDR